ncbi:MAG TPA: TetR/AcrR family transcriptional regulator [Acidimicrobiales bacterium]|nr:TetR/AcrR family transcriptional regulator [Acidimicrobiales bacterium]
MTPVTAEALERRRSRTRDEILDAAWELCREQGLTQLSLRELAARVGMRAPSLYSYFDSKDAIYDAMFAQGQEALVEAMAALPRDDVTRDDLKAGARMFFDFCTQDPVRYQLLFQRVLPGFVPSPASYALAVEVLDDLHRRLRSLGVVDPRHIDLWTALVTGLTDQQISNDPGGDRWSHLLEEAVDMFCDHAGVA